MTEATPENVKPGVWLRTSPNDRKYDPDVLCRCKSIQWYGDQNANNNIILEMFWDYDSRKFQFPPYEDEASDIGLNIEDISWYEIMSNLSIVDRSELMQEMMDISGMGYKKIVKEIFKG